MLNDSWLFASFGRHVAEQATVPPRDLRSSDVTRWIMPGSVVALLAPPERQLVSAITHGDLRADDRVSGFPQRRAAGTY
jgi:hypothetical protein